MPAVPHPYWPVFDIRLAVADVTLRPVTEADLVPLARLRPDDVESDPRLPAYAVPDADVAAGIGLHQSYWSSLGNWRPDSWRLEFAVFAGGVLAGMQDIEAEQFALRRTVETASWLGRDFRGRRIGKAMRLAVLALAFDGLAAEVAETEAWADNLASLGVSRALGYVDNGVSRHVRGERAEDMPRLRMTRTVWNLRHARHGVRLEGVAAARHLFGVASEAATP